jgi:hypothetical protein
MLRRLKLDDCFVIAAFTLLVLSGISVNGQPLLPWMHEPALTIRLAG